MFEAETLVVGQSAPAALLLAMPLVLNDEGWTGQTKKVLTCIENSGFAPRCQCMDVKCCNTLRKTFL